ncbi:glutamate synthase subunit beta [Saprospiraceae bacterium]|jgi:glutamate synthase (NADPH/NADH) small chain|nr:glutamate synthase subunit beta [Bacteroidota bacterium]MDB4727171.1 glutamate synthase subunit beta [Saprospiraceae bacterium]
MADPKGFLKHTRELPTTRDVETRLKDYKEIYQDFATDKTIDQASRCMDCGVPFCHNGCPLGNVIPEFNDAVYREDWKEAFDILSSTNNFPEFTGRICPAPCEAACVLGINQPAVAIEHIEKSISEKAYEMGYIKAEPPVIRTGKKVAVVGSGPAGLAAADQLNQAGHLVTVFERNDKVGGLLRYGIPDFKLEKWIIERRVKIMEDEGIEFRTNAHIGDNIDPKVLLNAFDCVVLCGGSTVPRDLQIKGRELNGVHFAMDFLEQQNRRVSNIPVSGEDIFATDKNVVVIGGGDTGADCVGTSNRQKAKSVTQLEIMPIPNQERDMNTWPNWPLILRTSSSHEEGCDREWAINTKEFVGDEQGNLKALKLVELVWEKDTSSGRYTFKEKPDSEKEIPCELALLAAGFLHPQKKGMIAQLDLDLDERGNIKTENYQTSNPMIFSAGDMRRGQSLVVWAIAEGREAAKAVDTFLGSQ